jgi:hypothetical protein
MKAYTKEKLQPLIEKYQRTLTLEDVEVIVELDKIADDIEKGVKAIEDCDWFSIDGHFFKKPTFAREQLMQRIFERCKGGIFEIAGALYSLDLERTPEEISGTPSKFALLKYIATLDVPIKKAMSKIEEVFNLTAEDESKKEKDGGISTWSLCAVLAREIGGSPDEWYDATPEKINSAIKVIEEKAEAESKAAGITSPPKDTPRIRAIAKFLKLQRELEASWQES